MDNRAQVRDFLSTRRAKLKPTEIGLPADSRRRVPGLRRSEVAALAGVSIEYYSQIERGDLGGVSASVLEAIAGALRLDDAETAHLFHLAQASSGSPLRARTRRKSGASWTASPGLQRTLDMIHDAPAIVYNGRGDLLGANLLGKAMYADLVTNSTRPPNFNRYIFLDERARTFYTHWGSAADIAVAMIRTEIGRSPDDRQLHELVGELTTRSEEFRRRWNTHDVRIHTRGVKLFHHSLVGALELTFETFALVAEPDLVMTVFTPEPASATAESLHLLASWAATQSPAPDSNRAGGARHGRQ